MLKNNIKDDFWDHIETAYPKYPTVRHRKRFVVSAIEKYFKINEEISIFDFGCGNGSILSEIKKTYALKDNQLSGSDTSEKAINLSKQKIPNGEFYNQELPRVSKKYDIIICSEVIEHTREYMKILYWIKENLKNKGIVILSTQSGKMYKIDEYSGHTQTFEKNNLGNTLNKLGLQTEYSTLWGWPLFSLQKFLTNYKFDKIKDGFLEGRPSFMNSLFLSSVYYIYFVHYFFNKGPQIFIVAKNN